MYQIEIKYLYKHREDEEKNCKYMKLALFFDNEAFVHVWRIEMDCILSELSETRIFQLFL